MTESHLSKGATNPEYDRDVVGRGRAQSRFSGCHGFECSAQEARMPIVNNSVVAGAESSPSEVEEIRMEVAIKRLVESLAPD
ncbi:hypothetical protein B296_00046108 [Ensete ventricosum]|uniref:Uncharacterized protein n=1 Tax=Ensete ventricosum TaxID=4639 RepID=A0A426XLD3_ENSVE|nr:hypothetical protein B296_00046108 [Ensete ventricosum]